MENHCYSVGPFGTNYALTGDYLDESVMTDDIDGQCEDALHIQQTDSSSWMENVLGNDDLSYRGPIPSSVSYSGDYSKTPSTVGSPDLGAFGLPYQHGLGASSDEIWSTLSTSTTTTSTTPSSIPSTNYSPPSNSPPIWPIDPSFDDGFQWTTLPVGSSPSPQKTPDDAHDDSSTRCWEHGCNGRRFSTRGNLVRHQREKAKRDVKAYCFNCGAFFTRTTARDKHIINQSCGRIRRYSNGRIRPLFARSMGLPDVTSSSNAANNALNTFMDEGLLQNDQQAYKSPDWIGLALR
ncbi:hypothetical protein GGS26DRAFT_539112 [Hypomontagnella submonticulosa]|nr:hypothetical protein GGS26DRAFT_539112 [Hypomontagnella submonticulosa]